MIFNQNLNLLSPYTFLNDDFYDLSYPAEFPLTKIRFRNSFFQEFECLDDQGWISLFAKFNSDHLPQKRNTALKYHGHQFQVYNPDIGDGRGFTVAQFYKNNQLLDLGTKGSGITKYSRNGDGKLTLKGGIREVLCACYLDALGVNTSKALSLIETGEQLYRSDEKSPTRSSVLVRVSHSHLRIGTFQYHAYHGNLENLKLLIHSINKYYFHFNNEINKEENFFKQVVANSATLAASYNINGFVHGVLNTDNINITGESFDYGPFRFLEKYDENKVAAYFDHSGLYRFSNQVNAIFWNLQQLASIMTLFLKTEDIKEILKTYPDIYNEQLMKMFFKKIMLKPSSDEKLNHNLISNVYEILRNESFLYEEVYNDLRGGLKKLDFHPDLKKKYSQFDLLNIFKNHSPSDNFDMEAANDSYLETLLYDEIEKIWSEIEVNDNWTLFNNKIDSINILKKKNQKYGLG